MGASFLTSARSRPVTQHPLCLPASAAAALLGSLASRPGGHTGLHSGASLTPGTLRSSAFPRHTQLSPWGPCVKEASPGIRAQPPAPKLSLLATPMLSEAPHLMPFTSVRKRVGVLSSKVETSQAGGTLGIWADVSLVYGLSSQLSGSFLEFHLSLSIPFSKSTLTVFPSRGFHNNNIKAIPEKAFMGNPLLQTM